MQIPKLCHSFQKAAGPGHRAGSLGDSERAQRQLCPERLLRAALGAAGGVPAGGARHLPSPARASVRAEPRGSLLAATAAPAALHLLLPCPGAQCGCSSSTTDLRVVFSPAKSWHQPVGRGQLAPPLCCDKNSTFFALCDFGCGMSRSDVPLPAGLAAQVSQQQHFGADTPKCWDGEGAHCSKLMPWPSAALGLCR